MNHVACKYCSATVVADTAGMARRRAIDAGWGIAFPEGGPNEFACSEHVDRLIDDDLARLPPAAITA